MSIYNRGQQKTMGYLANSSMRLAIRRLSSGQRSFKLMMLFAPVGSGNTWVNKDFSTIYKRSNSAQLILIYIFSSLFKDDKMTHIKKTLPLLRGKRHQSPGEWIPPEQVTFPPDDKAQSTHFLSSPISCRLSLLLFPSCPLICTSPFYFYWVYLCFLAPNLMGSLPLLQLLRQT